MVVEMEAIGVDQYYNDIPKWLQRLGIGERVWVGSQPNMDKALRMCTFVRSGGTIQVSHADLTEGENVEIIVLTNSNTL